MRNYALLLLGLLAVASNFNTNRADDVDPEPPTTKDVTKVAQKEIDDAGKFKTPHLLTPASKAEFKGSVLLIDENCTLVKVTQTGTTKRLYEFKMGGTIHVNGVGKYKMDSEKDWTALTGPVSLTSNIIPLQIELKTNPKPGKVDATPIKK